MPDNRRAFLNLFSDLRYSFMLLWFNFRAMGLPSIFYFRRYKQLDASIAPIHIDK
jgi:hypothetical protein